MSKKEQIRKINDSLEEKIIETNNAILEVVELSKLLKNALNKTYKLSEDTYLEARKACNAIDLIESDNENINPCKTTKNVLNKIFEVQLKGGLTLHRKIIRLEEASKRSIRAIKMAQGYIEYKLV